jgi:hypothetical protein
MGHRNEFTKETKRAAIKRSRGRCEATGAAYGFPRGHRCNARLEFGVEFDHYPVRAADGGSGDLENCRAVCIKCHRWKTAKRDLPSLAKGQRLRDKAWKIVSRSSPLPGGRKTPFKRKIDGTVVSR